MDGTSSASSNDCQPIAFESQKQVDGVVQALLDNLDQHIREQCKGKDTRYSRDVRELIEKAIIAQLPSMLHQNITVRGLSWEDHVAKETQTTQPMDPTLLRSTIEAQDSAFALSSMACVKRGTKTTQLASQVDARIRKVGSSGVEKTTLLDEQKRWRESRRRLVGGEVPHKDETAADLQKVEAMVEASTRSIEGLLAKAGRARNVADELESLART